MTATQKYLLRVYLAADVAMKLTLTQRPHSVDELKTIMQQKFRPRLDGEFTLQYEDPDFDGMLSCLMDIDELPEKGTLRVVRSESDESSLASSDTDILPHVPLHPANQKHNILEKMAETIFGFKAYPTERDLAKAAEALVTTHPCLSERGSETVWYGWKIRLAHKMGNYRTIMSNRAVQRWQSTQAKGANTIQRVNTLILT
ncbi:hypothetical protein WMY93_034177 [Mugilogobius chulae]|uniref:PB1 domain-containing protein n=1 Tax=Mugilogobius chulae TaxID=88201 RepID=A0AAW0MIS5_9GOBI